MVCAVMIVHEPVVRRTTFFDKLVSISSLEVHFFMQSSITQAGFARREEVRPEGEVTQHKCRVLGPET